MGIGNYWTSQLTLEISPWQVVWPRVVVIAGLSMVFAPLNVAAFLYIPKELRAPRSGCSPCCATKAAAWARRSPKQSTSGATNFTVCALANISIH